MIDAKESKLDVLIKSLDLYRVDGVIKIENISCNNNIPKDIYKKRLSILNFSNPLLHKTNNSRCLSNLIIDTTSAIKKDMGMNLVKILVMFRSE